MSNYLVWRDHGEEELGAESIGNEDDDCMDELVPNIGREYEVGSGEQRESLEVQNFYSFIAAANEKVHDGTDVAVLQVVTCLMAIKLKYNFLNQCYNDIIKLIIDLIPTKHTCRKTCTGLKRLRLVSV
jgi:hypothetical protein